MSRNLRAYVLRQFWKGSFDYNMLLGISHCVILYSMKTAISLVTGLMRSRPGLL